MIKTNIKQGNKGNALNDNFLNENQIIFKKYKVIKEIGKGSFSRVYSTIRLNDKSVFAMKTEKKNLQRNLLESEAYYLYNLQGFGIPKLITFGHFKNYNILIETLLGKSLYEIFIKKEKTCDLINTCLIALQLIDRLEYIHSKNIIYCDVKPDNFLIGIEDPYVIYIVDFGLCKKYKSSKTGKHIRLRNTKKFNGTIKYSSVNIIKGIESSRRDDLISLGYVLIFLYKRNLPWRMHFRDLKNKQYLELIHSKETNDDKKLFEGIPKDFEEYILYTQKLKFEEDPNYEYMKGLFKNILNNMNSNINELNFCWTSPNNKNTKAVTMNPNNRRNKSRIRIMQSLNKIETKKHEIKSLRGIETDIKNNFKKKIKLPSKNIENNSLNLHHGSNVLNENNNKNYKNQKKEPIDLKFIKNDYLNDKKNITKKKDIGNYIYTMDEIKRIQKIPANKVRNSLINKVKVDYKRINTQQNIYIDNNLFDFKINKFNNKSKNFNEYSGENEKKELNNNLHLRHLMNSTYISPNIRNKVEYKSKLFGYNNDYSLNKISDVNASNNQIYKNLNLSPFNSIVNNNDNLYNSFINKSKVYKINIIRENNFDNNFHITTKMINISRQKNSNGKSLIKNIPQYGTYN